MYWAINEGATRRSSVDTTVPPSTALAITHEYNFGRAYASTLRAWRLRMLFNRRQILAAA
ncbi:hypothetical protein PINS_up017148 [Pythium insidiosum]|nr:hypothetical protein PINS_up017148 [Pythium insidiosum]